MIFADAIRSEEQIKPLVDAADPSRCLQWRGYWDRSSLSSDIVEPPLPPLLTTAAKAAMVVIERRGSRHPPR
jgi:hypothetical protein